MLKLNPTMHVLTTAMLVFAIANLSYGIDVNQVDLANFATLQAAVDANPGRMLFLPSGDYPLTTTLRLSTDGSGLYGPGRLVQSNPDQAIVKIDDASGVRLVDIACTRAAGQMEARAPAILLNNAQRAQLRNITVADNHSNSSIQVIASDGVTIEGSTIRNYKGITLDDRTKQPLSGFAFMAIDGVGIRIIRSQGVLLRGNRIEDQRLLPTKAVRDQYNLGTLTVVPEKPGRLMDPDILETKYTCNWHQGAAIQVDLADESRDLIITDNYISHPAQGLDIHGDNVVVANNIITHAMIGLKAIHGSKHVLIDGNQFIAADLWGVLLYPGAKSREARNADAGTTATNENVDGGTIVSNNIFSNFGFGDQYWNWVDHKTDYPERNVIAVLFSQLAENPPIRDLVISGNLVYDSGRDQIKQDGTWRKFPPRYLYALYVEQTRKPLPVNIRAWGNLLNPGLKGATNLPDATEANP